MFLAFPGFLGVLLGALATYNAATPPEPHMPTLKVASWNLQNLFDTTASDIAADLEFTPEQGWDAVALDKKLNNLAAVIKLMHGGQGPDLLGICEVENKPLLEELVRRTGLPHLVVSHQENPDIRGIDTALIYSSQVFEPNGEPVGHNIHFRHPTRDVFEVPLKVKATGALLHCFVNHWPSRSRGQYESEPLRIAVAENCALLVQNLLKFKRQDYLAMADAPSTLQQINRRFDANVLLMGDFNDEPYSRSVVDYLLATKDFDQLEEVFKKAPASAVPARKHTPTVRDYLNQKPYLFNCMWPQAGLSDHGSFHFSMGVNTFNMIDQFMVSRGLLLGRSGLQLVRDSVRVFEAPPMASRLKKRPVAFDKLTKKGTSDHFPIEAEIAVL
jgi:Endonuclease/Exonuclease/phosphatase family